jgi:transcription elongation GreA/GreB family factor
MPTYFTKEGYNNHLKLISSLEDKLKYLQSRIQNAFEVGGGSWHDNADYEHLIEDIRLANSRLNEAYSVLNDVEIISYPSSIDRVVLGCEVKLLLDGDEKTYKIVAYGESDLSQNKITYTAPIAQMILDKKVGDVIKRIIGNKEEEIEILDIQPYDSSS